MNPLHLLLNSRELHKRVAKSRERLYRAAYAWTHDAALADDLTQEALAKALKNIGQLRDKDSLETWLFSILNNCWRDHYRRQRETVDIDNFDFEHPSSPEKEHGQDEITQRVRRAVNKLPEGQRQVLTLVDLEDFSYAQVAEILDVPIGTVMSRLCRARQALKKLLLEYQQGQEFSKIASLRRVK